MDVEIDYEQLKRTIDKTRIISGHQFEYREKIFSIFLMRHTKQDQKEGIEPIFWNSNSRIGDYDIYLPTNLLKRDFRKPVLLHETLEAVLQEYLPDKDKIIAHNIARRYDEIYAKEKLNNDLFKEYLKLRDKLKK